MNTIAVFDNDARRWRAPTAADQCVSPAADEFDRREAVYQQGRRADVDAYLRERARRPRRDKLRAAGAVDLAERRRLLAWTDALDEAEGDAEHIAWLASGEADRFPDLLAAWQAKRTAARKAAETEMDAIEGAARRVRMAADSTDEAIEAANIECDRQVADWHRRFDHLYPKTPTTTFRDDRARYEAAVEKAEALRRSVPPPSNWKPQMSNLPMPAGSLVTQDPATTWAEIDGHSTPVPSCSDNVAVFLRRAGVALRWNGWLERIEISRDGDAWSAYSDTDLDALMTLAAGAKHRFRPAEALFRRAVSTLARTNSVDSALDRLNALEAAWDGTPRLTTWLSSACGVPCDAYHQAVGRNIIGGMVRRIRQPGIKHDTMVVFIGDQGAGKSTLALILAGGDESFTDAIHLGIETKELLPLLRGKAIVEISEMRSRGEADAVKAMISRQVDIARLSYGREPVERPRRNIFVGTTNSVEVLEDATGGRRFLPVQVVGAIDLEWLRSNVDQLIGEAAALESRRASFDMPREIWALASEHQEAARARRDFEIVLEELFAPERGALYVSAADLVLLIRNTIGRSVNARDYSATMRTLGFVRATQRVNEVPTKVWRRGSAEHATRITRVMPSLPMPPFPPPAVTTDGAVTHLSD